MLIHLESGACSKGWKVRHINALATKAPFAEDHVIWSKLPWLLAGAPGVSPRSDLHFNHDRKRNAWICSMCARTYRSVDAVSNHQQTQTCLKGYPDVFKCPVCPEKFITLSGLVQHIETPRCPVSQVSRSVAFLLELLKRELAAPERQKTLDQTQYKLEFDPDRDGKLIVKVADVGGDTA